MADDSNEIPRIHLETNFSSASPSSVTELSSIISGLNAGHMHDGLAQDKDSTTVRFSPPLSYMIVPVEKRPVLSQFHQGSPWTRGQCLSRYLVLEGLDGD